MSICLGICILFTLPVCLLFYFQARNYCHGKTTNEVFSTRAQSTTSRTSAYILAQDDTDSDEEKEEVDPEADATVIMNSSVVDDMRI